MQSVYSRRWFVGRLGLFGCALPWTIRAQHTQPRRVRRIGFLSGAVPTLIKAFDDELRRLKYVDQENLIIEKRLSRPNTTDTAAHAAELARMNRLRAPRSY